MTEELQIDGRELDELTLEELKREILRVNDNQLYNIGHMAILEGLLFHIDLKENFNNNIDLVKQQCEDGEAISNLFEKISSKDLDIKLIVTSNEMSKELGKGYFQNLRKTCQRLLASLSGYITEISYINEIAYEIIHRRKITEEYNDVVESVNLEKFYQNVYKFLTEDMDLLAVKINDIISVLPLSISRKRYYDVLKSSIIKALEKNSKEEVIILLDRYKTIFNGTMEEDYGQKFDNFFRKTHKFKQHDLKSNSVTEIEEIYKDTTEALQELNTIVNILRQIGLIINRYIIINILKENLISFNDENKKIMELWDIYINRNDESLEQEILKTCENKIKDIEKRFSDENVKLHNLITEYDSKEGKIDKEFDKKLLKTQDVLSYFNDSNIEKEELLLKNEKENVSPDYLEQAVDNLVDFIDRNIKEMPNRMRKARMRRLLCLVELPFMKPDDFFNYLKNSVENISQENKIININLVAEVIARYRVKK